MSAFMTMEQYSQKTQLVVNMETVGKIVIGILTVALLVSLGLNVQPDDTHYCADRNITYHCDGFSKYYGLANGKCVNELLPNKLCSSGWEEIFPTPDPVEKNPIAEVRNIQKVYICDQKECVLLNGSN